jgi:hypothetical protein
MRDGIWFVSFVFAVWIVLRVFDPTIQTRVRIPHSRVDGATVLFLCRVKKNNPGQETQRTCIVNPIRYSSDPIQSNVTRWR